MSAEGASGVESEPPERERTRLLKPVWSSRDQARELRAKCDRPTQIDFAGVEIAASSFLDEYLGQLMEDCQTRGAALPELLNVSPEVRTSIGAVLERRGIDYQFPAARS